MKIEVGKFYRTRDGRKVGPVTDVGGAKRNGHWIATIPEGLPNRSSWWTNGRTHLEYVSQEDIVAEWSDGPVREVVTTRCEIVPGVYGGLVVDLSPAKGYVSVGIGRDARIWTAPELRAAIDVLTQLANVLEQ